MAPLLLVAMPSNYKTMQSESGLDFTLPPGLACDQVSLLDMRPIFASLRLDARTSSPSASS